MHRSPGGRGELWFGRIFILPHTIVGIGGAGYLVFLFLWALVGSNIPGVVTGTEITHSSKSGDRYILKYQYQAGAETKSGSGSVSQTIYDRFQSRELTNVTVRYFSLGPLEHANLHESGYRWRSLGMTLLWVGFWNSILSVFVHELWIKPLRRRQLYRHGAATAGTVLSKRVKTGKSSYYYVSYTFTDPTTGTSVNAETQVWSKATWDRAEAGQSVTVLYAPDNPKRSTIYEFGGYYVDLGSGIIS